MCSTNLNSFILILCRYGGAEPGDRTMLDSLHAAHQALCKGLKEVGPMKAMGQAVQVCLCVCVSMCVCDCVS